MMRNNKKYLIGLTGGSGAGKTTVSNILRAEGIYIIDADKTARSVQGAGTPCTKELAREFGGDILLPDGSLIRRKLAGIVFSDPKKLLRLNEITHKYITAAAEEEAKGHKPCGIDAAALIESGMDKDCEYVISVLADTERRVLRIKERDGLTDGEARRRISAQKPEEFYISHSDFVVRNDSTEESLIWQIQEILKEIGVGQKKD